MTKTPDGRPGSAPYIRTPSNASLLLLLWAMTLSCGRVAAQSVPQSAPPPNSNITAPGPQRHSAPSQPQSPPAGAAAPQPIRQMIGNGTIEGFVYWDTSAISHVPAGDCTGLAVNVAVAQSSTGPYTSMATLSNNFTYAGQVKQFLVGGQNKVYDVCTYGYGKVPVGLNLQVTVNVTSPTAFSPVAVPQNSIISPINIINAQCNMLPRIVNPTASDLFSKWGTCQNMAFDVNFEITKASQSLNSRGGVQRGTGSAQVSKGPVGTTLLTGTGKPALLNGPGSTPPQTQSAPGTQSQHSSGTLLGNNAQGNSGSNGGTSQTYTGNTRGSTPGGKVELNPQPFPPKQVLNNRDVLTMLNAGLAESVILSSLRSSQHKFDFSAASCRDLQRARVTANILNAMGDGSVRQCPEITGTGALSGAGGSANSSRQGITDITNRGRGAGLNPATATPGSKVELNPQPLPPGAKVPAPAQTKLQPVKLAPPTASRRMTNPILSQQNASIIAVLDQQKQLAQQDSAAMKSSQRTVASAASARTPVLAANLQGNTTPQTLSPGQTQSATVNVSSIAHAPAFNTTVLVCSTDPTPRILRVNGGQAPGIFTPEAKYNQYTIVGCGFGQSQGNARIFGVNGFTANLNIDFWSDNGITAHLDPWLAGVLDQNNVSVIVLPVGKQQLQKSGYKFYAARGWPNPDGTDQDVALPYDSMARPSVTMLDVNNFFNGFDQLPSNATSTFPSFSYNGTPVAGWVLRFIYGHADRIAAFRAHDCFINDVGFDGKACTRPDFKHLSRNDTWDFNKMAPGFAISGYSLYYDNIDASTLCGGVISNHSDASVIGHWDFTLNEHNQIVVAWPVYDCFYSEFGTRDSYADFSSYGLAVWVLGPRCVDPWTGQKDQSCMNKIKQTLS